MPSRGGEDHLYNKEFGSYTLSPTTCYLQYLQVSALRLFYLHCFQASVAHLLLTYHSPITHLLLTYDSPSTHLPLTYHSLATHLLLIYYSPTTHLPLTYPMGPAPRLASLLCIWTLITDFFSIFQLMT